MGPGNELALVHENPGGKSPRMELDVNEDYRPLAVSASGSLDAPLVFAGYGITAKKEGYDDYAGIDVKGKAVIVLRHEPQQDDRKACSMATRTRGMRRC